MNYDEEWCYDADYEDKCYGYAAEDFDDEDFGDFDDEEEDDDFEVWKCDGDCVRCRCRCVC